MDFLKEPQIISVSDLTHSIKSILELQYRFVHIRGEVSNLHIPYSGHTYFTLKDSTAQIKAVLFKGQQKYLKEKLKEGQQVICHGRISVYEPRGEYQIIVDTINTDGYGTLYQQFERLKEKLNDEGLFASSLKKEIPAFPQKIAIITSPGGAAIHDFLKISTTRQFYGDILIIPTLVQGKTAATDMVRSLELAHTITGVEVILLLRGGGSLEDLWCFNEEKTVRAIHASSIPLVTGVGHETDTTLADLAADLRTHTPTAAAEAIIPDSRYLRQHIESQRSKMIRCMEHKITHSGKDVTNYLRIIGDLDLYLGSFSLQIDHLLFRLQESFSKKIEKESMQLSLLLSRLHASSPVQTLNLHEEKLAFLKENLLRVMDQELGQKGLAFQKQVALLDSVNPLSILSRGYSITTSLDKTVVSHANQVEKGQQLDVRLHQGRLRCEVLSACDDSNDTAIN